MPELFRDGCLVSQERKGSAIETPGLQAVYRIIERLGIVEHGDNFLNCVRHRIFSIAAIFFKARTTCPVRNSFMFLM
jgi:hypothetical protein